MIERKRFKTTATRPSLPPSQAYITRLLRRGRLRLRKRTSRRLLRRGRPASKVK